MCGGSYVAVFAHPSTPTMHAMLGLVLPLPGIFPCPPPLPQPVHPAHRPPQIRATPLAGSPVTVSGTMLAAGGVTVDQVPPVSLLVKGAGVWRVHTWSTMRLHELVDTPCA